MTIKYASTPQELKALIYEEMEQRPSSQGDVAAVSSRKIKRRIRTLTNNIERGLNAYLASYSPVMYKRRSNGVGAGIFEGIIYNEATQTAEVRFAGNTWATNAVSSDPHESFIPVLLNYGWSVKGNLTGRRSGDPTFYYYRGNNFISNAIEEFNQQCMAEGLPLRAKFVVNGVDVETLYSNGGIPYRR